MAGNGSTTVLVGEAGMGKSQLIDALAQNARRAGALVLQIRSAPGPLTHPLDPLADMVDAAEAALAYTAGTTEANALRDAVRNCEPARQVRRLFDDLVARTTQALPTVVIFDPIRDDDVPLVEAVVHVARRCRNRRALIVAAARPDSRALDYVIDHVDTRILAVDPLDIAESRRFLEDLTGSLDDEQAAAIVRRAGGNPLYLSELAAHIADGAGADSPLQFLLLARLGRLGQDALAVARIAALMGASRLCSWRFCALAAGLDPDDRRPLHSLIEAGVASESPEGRLHFPRPAIPELIVSTMPDDVARELHGAAAQLLTLLSGDPTECAIHALAATRADDPGVEDALRLAVRAADDALEAGSPAVAEQLVDAALALHPAPETEAKLRTIRGEILLARGDNTLAAASFERSLEAANTHRARIGLARALQRSGRLDAALDVFGACTGVGADRGRAEVLLALGRVDEAATAARAAVQAARIDANPAVLASALADMALVQAVSAHPDAVTSGRDAVALWRHCGVDSLAWPPLFALGVALESSDQFAEALDVLLELRAWLDACGLVDQVPRVVRTETIAAFLSMSWERMHEAVAAAIDATRGRPNHEMGPIHAASAALAAARGDLTESAAATEMSKAALALQSTRFDRGLARWWAGTIALLTGDQHGAVSAMREAAAQFRSIGARDFLIRTLPMLCAAVVESGEPGLSAIAAEYCDLGAQDTSPSITGGRLVVDAVLSAPTARARALVDAADAFACGENVFGMLWTATVAYRLDPAAVPPSLRQRCVAAAQAAGCRIDLFAASGQPV
jgi:tetratricopeptide (TPR) repeat protein